MSKSKHSSYMQSNLTKKSSYEEIIHILSNIDSQYDSVSLVSSSAILATQAVSVLEQIDKFKSKIENIPFFVFIPLWARYIEQDKVFGLRYLDMMAQLLKAGLIEYRVNDKIMKMKEFADSKYKQIIDDIRCYEQWSLDIREDFVSFYIYFEHWLSETTFGYVPKVEDYDRKIAERHKLPFDIYIRIIKELADRERILAKIFYLGGARSLEEVLSLKIEDINPKECILKISGEAIRYPKHVFEDLREYVDPRKRGYVFANQQGDRINHTVPYRALKTVITKLKLDPSFTFKDFVTNV